MRIAADVGGTHARFATGDGRRARFECARFDAFDDLVAAALAELGDAEEPVDAAFAVAGRVVDDRATFTNLPWAVDATRLRERFRFRRVVLRNDLAAAAFEAAHALPTDLVDVQPGACPPDARRVLVGVGTGLGVAYWRGGRADASEAGHTGFSPASDWQDEFAQRLRARHGRATWERAASGSALVALDELARGSALDGPADVVARARAGDGAAALALSRWSALLGAFAGDLVLAGPEVGAVLLAGGSLARVGDAFDVRAFRDAFVDKGRMSSWLTGVPVWRTGDDALALRGALRCISP